MALALSFVGATLALLYLLPIPATIQRADRPPYEEFPKQAPPVVAPKQTHGPARPLQPHAFKTPGLPKVAILIDDMGYDLVQDTGFFQIDAPLSFAFLPHAPHTKEMAEEAHQLKRDILVHLPLESSHENIALGPGALRLGMPSQRFETSLDQDIRLVPDAIGLNNHMGSKYTANGPAMEHLLYEVKRRRLFFVDSLTTSHSVAFKTARAMGIPSAERNVFLDHEHNAASIRKACWQLVRLACENGSAVAIGHPFADTLEVLKEELPRMQKKVKVVPIHEILVR